MATFIGWRLRGRVKFFADMLFLSFLKLFIYGVRIDHLVPVVVLPVLVLLLAASLVGKMGVAAVPESPVAPEF